MWNRSETAGVWAVRRVEGEVVQVERVTPRTVDGLERKREMAAQQTEQEIEPVRVVKFTTYLVQCFVQMFT